jgi:heme/copper-type cytochrome/quinol oxidase subunit 2
MSVSSLRSAISYLIPGIATMVTLCSTFILPPAFAQSPEVSAEWALFNQILLIGIGVGIVVFGIMFYAIIRYREKPQRTGAN